MYNTGDTCVLSEMIPHYIDGPVLQIKEPIEKIFKNFRSIGHDRITVNVLMKILNMVNMKLKLAFFSRNILRIRTSGSTLV